MVLWGLGGVGKTQIANEYAYRNWSNYNIICWLRGERSETLEDDYYLQLAPLLGITFNNENREECKKNIIHALENRNDWLFVFDNAGNIDDFVNYLPKKKTGNIIVTSRNHNWEDVKLKIRVPDFDDIESVLYITCMIEEKEPLYIVKNNIKDDDLAEKLGVDKEKIILARKLADEMEHLPIALRQACAYINEHKTKISTYLLLCKNIKSQRKYTLPPIREIKKDYPYTIDTTWSISVEEIKRSCPSGFYLLNLCAFMAPERIPIKLIRRELIRKRSQSFP